MHILLTDILTCPRCGPEFGLILIADRMAERRVIEGALGCANCRDRYPVERGTVRFAVDGVAAGTVAVPQAAAGAVAESGTHSEAGVQNPAGTGHAEGAALRVAALLGVTEGPAWVLLAGPVATLADGVAELVEALEVVVAADPTRPPGTASGAGVNRLEIERPLPLVSARMAGVALSGAAADALLEEGARVLAPLGRLILEPPPENAAARLAACGMQVIAHEGDTMIAANRHAAPRPGGAAV